MAARKPKPTGPVSPEEYARIVADAMTEAAFQKQVADLAKSLGWRFYHTHDSRRSERGFLDCCAVRGPRLIFAELKRQDEVRYKTTPEQEQWIHDLGVVTRAVQLEVLDAAHVAPPPPKRSLCPSVEVYLWRPLDITSNPNRILEVLR